MLMKDNLTMLRKLALFISCFFLISAVIAQEKTITGTVTSFSDGGTLPGVNVVVKGTTIGTITNIDGQYEIQVPADATTLVFSFVGMVPEEAEIGSQTVIDITMVADIMGLDEVVVIGYGTQKKSDKTGAVAHIKAEELSGGVLTDPIQGIQGKSAGVLISKKGGDPNSGFSVQIRGASGFDSETEPLYVIDGVPGMDPTAIAPEDIESFNILKDAASTAIYGSRGSNGVIIITTKKGSSDRSQVSFNSKVSLDYVANKYDVLTADEIRDYAQQIFEESFEDHPDWTIDSVFTDRGASTDWQDQIFRRGITYSNNLSFSGGNESSTYHASLTQADWQGVMKGTEKKRTTAKLNLTHKALNDKLTLSGSIFGAFENNDYENYDGWDKDDIIYQALTRNPTDPVRTSDGEFFQLSRQFNYENPLAVIERIDNVRAAKNFMGNVKADYEFIQGLVGSINMSYLQNDRESSYFRPKGIYASEDNGYARKEYNNDVERILESTLNYQTSLDDIHNLNLLGGYSYRELTNNGFWMQGENPGSEYISYNDFSIMSDVAYGDLDSWKEQEKLIGFFGRAQYNFMSKYFAAASIRRDGSTKFGENNRWGWFPTFAVGWSLDKESFFENITVINQLKLRASYGISGNQAIGRYRSLRAFEPVRAVDPNTGDYVITFSQAWVANPDLKWEETSEINIGIDFALLSNKISGSLEIYRKETKDLLGEYSVPVPPNPARRKFANSGTLENKGVELFVQVFAINNANFKWKTSLNASTNRGKFLDLGELVDPETGVRQEGYLSGPGAVSDALWVTGVIEGEAIGTFYLPEYVDILDGAMIYRSKSGGYTDILTDAKRTIVGNATPDFEIGWSNSLIFMERWTLDISFRSQIGNDMYNATRSFLDVPNRILNINTYDDAYDWYYEGREGDVTIADFYVEDASFLRLDYLSLGYDFHVDRINWVDKFHVYFASNNLLTLTNYSGVDPETSVDGLAYGIDLFNVYPKTRTFTFGINANF